MSEQKNSQDVTPTPDPPLGEKAKPAEDNSKTSTPASSPPAEDFSIRSALSSAGGAGQGASPAAGQTIVHEAKIAHQWHFISTFNKNTIEKLQQNVQMAII